MTQIRWDSQGGRPRANVIEMVVITRSLRMSMNIQMRSSRNKSWFLDPQ